MLRAALRLALTFFVTLALTTSLMATDAAYIWADDPSAVSYAPSPAYTFNAGAPVSVTRLDYGTYRVDLGAIVSGAGGNVQVTGYGLNGDYCNISSWSSGSAFVNCFNANTTPGDTQFSLFVLKAAAGEVNDELAYVWANNPATANYTPNPAYTYNNGNPVSISRNGTGVYTVALGTIVATPGGNVQVTAYGPESNRCKVQNWSAGNVQVNCFDGSGNPSDSRFSLLFVRANLSDEGLAYVWGNNPAAANYTPNPAYSFNLGAPVSITRQATGTYKVQLGNIASGSGQNAQVTAYGATNDHCKVVSWSGGAVNVRCFAPNGTPTDAQFSLFVGNFPG